MEKFFIMSPPKRNNANTTTKVVPDVTNVRDNVWLMDRFIITSEETSLRDALKFSLTLSKKIKSMTDFVTAGRNVNLWLGVASMAGTEMGLITIMYSAQKGFSGGFAAFHIAIVAGIVTFLIGLTGFIVVPLRKFLLSVIFAVPSR